MNDDRFSFHSATVYFSGGYSSDVVPATLNGNSLIGLTALINRCEAGSVITFDNVKVSGPDGVRVIEGKSFTLYSGTDDTSRIQVSLVNKELFQLMKKEFVYGTIYFSGANFPNVVIHTVKKNEPVNLFMRCASGSIIAFENCIYKNDDGTLSKPFTKTIKQD